MENVLGGAIFEKRQKKPGNTIGRVDYRNRRAGIFRMS